MARSPDCYRIDLEPDGPSITNAWLMPPSGETPTIDLAAQPGDRDTLIYLEEQLGVRVAGFVADHREAKRNPSSFPVNISLETVNTWLAVRADLRAMESKGD